LELRRVARFVQTCWSIAGICLLLLLALNWGIGLLIRGITRSAAVRSIEKLTPTADQAWVEQFVAERGSTEFMSSAVRWEPYVYWRSAEHQGQFFNVDRQGLRRTINPPALHSTTPRRRIMMFGGSALWGDSVRDEFTLASILAKRLHEEQYSVEVTNFGQLGYVSTQQVIALLSELRRGIVPNLVIYYGGTNDIGAAAHSAQPGESISEVNRVLEFNLLNDNSITRLLKNCALNSAVSRFVRMSNDPFWTRQAHDDIAKIHQQRIKSSSNITDQLRRAPEGERAQLAARLLRIEVARDALSIYGGNVQATEVLSDGFGFESLYFWPPTVFDKEHRTSDEQQIVENERDNQQLFDTVRQQWAILKQSGGKSIHPIQETVLLADVFNSTTWTDQTAFFDAVHVTEAANAEIVERMLPEVRACLERMDKVAP